MSEEQQKNINNDLEWDFSWPVRVYFEDTDAGGIVYHAQYLHFLERARTEWLRNLGFNQSELKLQGILFVVRDMAIKWINPARLDDELIIKVSIEQINKASLIMKQVIMCGNIKKLTARVTIACLDGVNMKPTAIPKNIVM
ncbi:MAG: acyl-CoA thioester hydrolase [Bermanella sp.]|jgi:acyl-CoA thioester hydrolase